MRGRRGRAPGQTIITIKVRKGKDPAAKAGHPRMVVQVVMIPAAAAEVEAQEEMEPRTVMVMATRGSHHTIRR